jgi:hypothetical protein
MNQKKKRYFSKEGIITIAILFLALVAVSIFGLPRVLRLPIDVTGIIVDRDTGLPIEGAQFNLPLTDYRVKTDSLGKFTIKNLKPKQYYARIWHANYDDAELFFSVPYKFGRLKLDTIKLSLGNLAPWPIPDSIKTDNSLKGLYFDFPEGCFSSRTNKLSELPNSRIEEKQDSFGGRWILGHFRNVAVPSLTYISPGGILESCLPTALHDPVILNFKVFKDTLTIVGREPYTLGKKEFKLVYTISDMVVDTDKDGLIDKFEEFYGLDSKNPDTDGDGIDDLYDPLPTIAKSYNTNDTLRVLRKCLELIGRPFSLYSGTGNKLSSIIEALPFAPAKRLREIAEHRIDFYEPSLKWEFTYGLELVKMPSRQTGFGYPYRIYGKNFSERIPSFEITLIGLTPEEIRYFYPFLKAISSGSYNTDREKQFRFPYLESLASVDALNVSRIRQEILSCAYTALIQPQIIDGILLDYPAHPSVSGAMYIKAEGYYNCENIKKTAPRMPLLEILRMDDNSAIVRVKITGQIWDKVLLKRGDDWIIVGDYPYSKQLIIEEPCDRISKEIINVDWGDEL